MSIKVKILLFLVKVTRTLLVNYSLLIREKFLENKLINQLKFNNAKLVY